MYIYAHNTHVYIQEITASRPTSNYAHRFFCFWQAQCHALNLSYLCDFGTDNAMLWIWVFFGFWHAQCHALNLSLDYSIILWPGSEHSHHDLNLSLLLFSHSLSWIWVSCCLAILWSGSESQNDVLTYNDLDLSLKSQANLLPVRRSLEHVESLIEVSIIVIDNYLLLSVIQCCLDHWSK